LTIGLKKQQSFSYLPFRIMAVLFGAFTVAMGWEALSQGYLWNSGYNPRIGDETTGTTLSWVVIGGLFILAGIFPWRWLVNRGKHKPPRQGG
jgi:hypothetical protein